MSPKKRSLDEKPSSKRRRNSKLDAFYYSIAQLMLDNSKSRARGEKILSLDKIRGALETKHKVAVHKSTLCRYLTKHNALKLL